MNKYINKKTTSLLIEVLSLFLVFFVGYLLFLNNSFGLNTFNGGDVHRGFHRGLNILNGVNSYYEFNPNKMLIQEKVPGFFPLYFYLMAVIVWLSKYSAVLFFDNLRYLVFFSYLGIGLLIYLKIRKKSKLLAIFLMCLFMFNRWTIDDVLSLKQDSYVILLTLVSMLLLKKHRFASYFLFGVATGIKHITVFLFPIYMYDLFMPIIYVRKKEVLNEIRKGILCLVLALFPVIIPSIPYLIETPNRFVSAIMYNLTRESEGSSQLLAGFDKLLVLYNQDKNNTPFYYALPRLPMLVVFSLLFFSLFTGKINMWKYSAIAYLVFVAFNPVIFGQYYTWFMAFLPLVFTDES